MYPQIVHIVHFFTHQIVYHLILIFVQFLIHLLGHLIVFLLPIYLLLPLVDLLFHFLVHPLLQLFLINVDCPSFSFCRALEISDLVAQRHRKVQGVQVDPGAQGAQGAKGAQGAQGPWKPWEHREHREPRP